VKVQLYLCGLLWVKKISIPQKRVKTFFCNFAYIFYPKNVEMSRSVSSLRFITKTLSEFKNAKVTVVPMGPDEG